MRMKKFLTFLLTIAMVVSLLPATAFAANNTATTMRLAKTQGTVAVTNVTGKKVKQTSNMKLYNGYKLKTGSKSYAWISLDDTKVAKLDANSAVSVQKTGQKLTLYLSSGNLFFNVKDPLKAGESFQIKTSTMTTGIRGTSGCVRVISDRVTEIHLLTGQVEIYTENPEMKVSKTAILKAGQKAYSLIAEDAMAATGEQADIIIEKLTNHEVCGNCSVEIAADPELVERIEEEAPHLLPEEIADTADERLAADEQAAEEKQKEIDEAVANQVLPEEVDPLFEEEKSSGGGGGGGGSSAVTPSNVVRVSTWTELVNAVNDYNAGTDDITIEVVAEIDQGTETSTITVEPTSNNNTLTIDLTTAGITMSSTIVNNGNLIVTNTAGYIVTTAATVVENNLKFTLDDGTLQTTGTSGQGVLNTGTFNMVGGSIIGKGTAVRNEGGTFDMTDGTITMERGTGATEPVYAYRDEAGSTATFGGTAVINVKVPVVDSALANRVAAIGLVHEDAKADMTGGTINLYEGATSGADVRIGTFQMSGGTINQITEESSDAGMVGIYAFDDVSITNGTINVGNGGSGVKGENAAIQMTGGTIDVKELDTVGFEAGVEFYGGSFTMTGGEIKVTSGVPGSSADTDYPYGIYCGNSSTVQLDSGSVSATGARAHALYVPDEANIKDGNLGTTLTATFMDNVMGDVRPAGYRVVQKDGVYTPEDTTSGYEAATKEELDAILQDIQTTFKSNKEAVATIILKDNIEISAENDTDENADDIRIEKGMRVILEVGEYTLTVKEPIQNNGDLTITSQTGNGKVESAAALPLIDNAGTLTLKDTALRLTSEIMSSSAPMAVVNTTGDFIMESGAIGMNLTTGTNFADVIVDGGSFTMNGGVIDTATADKASGIIVKNEGECTLTTGNINVNAKNGYGVHNINGTVNLNATKWTSDTERSNILVTAAGAVGVYNEDTGTLTADGGHVSASGKGAVGILNGTKTITLAGIRGGATATDAVFLRSTGSVLMPRHLISAGSGGTGIELLGGASVIGDLDADYDTSSVTDTRITVNNEGTGIHLKNDASLIFRNTMYVNAQSENTTLGIKVDENATLQLGTAKDNAYVGYNHNVTPPSGGAQIESAGKLILQNASVETWFETALKLTGGTAEFVQGTILASKGWTAVGTAIDATPAAGADPVTVSGSFENVSVWGYDKDKIFIGLEDLNEMKEYKIAEKNHSDYYKLMKVYEIDSVETLNTLCSNLYKYSSTAFSLKLMDDITLTEDIDPGLNGNTTFELDLNGYDLDMKEYQFNVTSNGPDLMITDTSSGGNGTVTGTNAKMFYTIYAHLYGGKVIVPVDVLAFSAQTYIHGGTMEINGGTGTDRNIEMDGGKIIVNSGKAVDTKGTFTMEEGTITVNGGTGVSAGTVTINGGSITVAADATGVYCDGTATIADGVLSGNGTWTAGTAFAEAEEVVMMAALEEEVIPEEEVTEPDEEVIPEEVTEPEEEIIPEEESTEPEEEIIPEEESTELEEEIIPEEETVEKVLETV